MLDLGISALEWKTCFDVDDIEVVPTCPCSPLHMHIRDRRSLPGLYFRQTAEPQKLLQWQAARGFAKVPEGALRALVRETGAVEDSHLPAIADASEVDVMAMALLRKLLPETTAEKACQILLSRNFTEDALATSYVDDFDEKAVNDVILLGDAEERVKVISWRQAA